MLPEHQLAINKDLVADRLLGSRPSINHSCSILCFVKVPVNFPRFPCGTTLQTTIEKNTNSKEVGLFVLNCKFVLLLHGAARLGKSSQIPPFNSLAPAGNGLDFKSLISEEMLRIKFMITSCEMALRWIPYDDSTLI